jgi:Ser/Thr protein kinase RdoA (MazF antagonist)
VDWVREQLRTTGSMFEAKDPGTMTLTHGDFFPDNIVVQSDGSMAILDWEHAAADFPVVDLGFAIAGMANEDGLFSAERMTTFLRGYASSRPLQTEDIEHLRATTIYAAAIMGFLRYVRSHIFFPETAANCRHLEMQHLGESIPERWPDTRVLRQMR